MADHSTTFAATPDVAVSILAAITGQYGYLKILLTKRSFSILPIKIGDCCVCYAYNHIGVIVAGITVYRTETAYAIHHIICN